MLQTYCLIIYLIECSNYQNYQLYFCYKQHCIFQMNENLDKATHVRLKYTSIDDIIPQYYVPEPKRKKGMKLQQENQGKSNMLSNNQMTQNEVQDIEISEARRMLKKKNKNISFKFSRWNSSMQHKFQTISKVLQYLFCESDAGKKVSYTKDGVYRSWQAGQILNHTQDTNLGDFIIKLPNPDNMPQKLDPQKNEKQQNSILMQQILIIYDAMFNTEQISDKLLANYQQQAFELAFYLLDIRGGIIKPKIDHHKDAVTKFLTQFKYYITISEMDIVRYIQVKKTQSFQENQKKIIDQFYIKQIRKIKNAIDQGKSLDQLNLVFQSYKGQVYQKLNKRLAFNRGGSQQFMRHPFTVCLFLNAPSISSIFHYFPDFLDQFLVEVKAEKRLSRKYCYGGCLNKSTVQNTLKWTLQQQRPQDVLTLLRRMLMYKLTRRGGLFVRSFLSENQNYIFLVIKSSQTHLQSMAQKKNFNMQLQFGAIDLFAFEPIDNYKRPLRCNKYVRDPEFKKKYNLFANKQDKDQNCGQRSIQSEAITLYVRAQEMNQEELRAKIMLDQEECDEMYRWLSKTMSLRYVNDHQVVFNQYNTDEVDPEIWPVYYIYNKLIIEGIYRLRQSYTSKNNNNQILQNLKKNLGLILRLMFLKAQDVCNNIYRKHRKTFARSVKNQFVDTEILQNVYNSLNEDFPRGYWPYFYSQKLDRMWRKYQINQNKDRSKFTSASRTLITNEIIRQSINISGSINQNLIIDFFPIHDPYILKNIKVKPYLQVLEKLIDEKDVKVMPVKNQNPLRDMFIEYECYYTQQDFMKDSVYEKLSFKFSKATEFSVNSVAFYCGEKLAFFFQLRRFLIEKTTKWTIIAFIIQIIFWVETTHIYQFASSSLTTFNNVVMTILVIFNIIWVDRTIASWQAKEKSLARAFGTGQLTKRSEKRVLFRGTMQRNMQTDEVNYETVSKSHNIIKSILAFIFNLAFIVFMGGNLLMIFVLKGYLYQQGYSQSLVTQLPAILISIAVIVFNFIYKFLVKIVVDFQNKRTLEDYQSSLSMKNFIITFIVSYFVLYVYGFFSSYFSSSNICLIKTNTGTQIYNCYYYLSSQLVTSSIIDLLTTVAMAFLPYLMFRYQQYSSNKMKSNSMVSFNNNYFESIDQFYEEQDQMSTYMYTDDVDNTWIQYTTIVISFSTLVLFGPIVPFLYTMMFIAGLISLHSKKYEIIYFSKRTLPVKAGSIGSWLMTMKIVAIIGVFTNLALIIYVRQVFSQNRSIIYITSLFIILFLKYVATFIPELQDKVGKRSKKKAQELILDRQLLAFDSSTKIINTDIQNLYYDQQELKRRLPKLHKAYVKKKN